MYSYPLRATSVCGKYLVEFGLEHGPMPLDDKTFVLSGKPGSPILTYESILRGCDIPDIFAGDVIKHNDREYLISYHRGLVGRSTDEEREVLYLDSSEKYYMVSNIYNRELSMSSRPSTFPYKYEDKTFYLNDIYGMVGGCLAVNVHGGLLVPVGEARQYAGVKGLAGELVFFGDYGTKLVNGQIISVSEDCEINITKGGKFNE